MNLHRLYLAFGGALLIFLLLLLNGYYYYYSSSAIIAVEHITRPPPSEMCFRLDAKLFTQNDGNNKYCETEMLAT